MMDEIKTEILEKYSFRTELHAHTLPISRCSDFYAEELIELYKKVGVHSIVLTNHFTPDHIKRGSKSEVVKEYIDVYKRFKTVANENGIEAIFGMELRFTENLNDYLLYGIEESDVEVIYDFVDAGLEEFYKAFKKDGVLVVQAHPKRDRMTDIDTRYVDGQEGFNMHLGHNSRVALATACANEKGLIVTGGSDVHHLGHEGGCLLRSKCKITTSLGLCSVLESRDYVLDVGGSIILP